MNSVANENAVNAAAPAVKTPVQRLEVAWETSQAVAIPVCANVCALKDADLPILAVAVPATPVLAASF